MTTHPCRRRAAAFGAVLFAVLGAGPAAAASVPSQIVGGETAIEVTAPLGALGLDAAPVGSATVDTGGTNPLLVFDITGGRIAAGGAALIEHEGSGVELSDGATSVSVGNFLIDTGEAQVFGDVLNTPTEDLDLFDIIGSTSDGAAVLAITQTLSDALDGLFGTGDLAGAEFGFATPAPVAAPIPLPAGMPLLAAGLGGMILLRRRRRR